MHGANTFMKLGSSTWIIGSQMTDPDEVWHSESTDPRWDAGTSTVTLSSDHDTTVVSNYGLPVPEFNNLVIRGGKAAQVVHYTAQTQHLGAGNVTMSGGLGTMTYDLGAQVMDVTDTLTLQTGASLTSVGTSTVNTNTVAFIGGTSDAPISAQTEFFDGSVVDGLLITGTTMTTSSGKIRAVAWGTFTTGPVTNISWSFDPSVSSATVTITVSGLPGGTNYRLTRDGSAVGTDTDGSTTAMFVVTDGWSTHQMTITAYTAPSSGGGGATSNPPPPLFTLPGITLTEMQVILVGILVAALLVLALLHPKNKNQRVAIYVVIVAAAILLAATLLGLVY